MDVSEEYCDICLTDKSHHHIWVDMCGNYGDETCDRIQEYRSGILGGTIIAGQMLVI